jgi:hypothetical protein
MMTMRWLSLALFLTMTSAALALEDTQQNREQQVDRYLQATPPQAVFNDMMEKISQSMPPEQRTIFVSMMTKQIDFSALTAAMRGSMTKIFTADELAALADFYGSPVGKSAMSKMGDYMAELMPVMTAEMAKAQGAAIQEIMKQPKQ